MLCSEMSYFQSHAKLEVTWGTVVNLSFTRLFSVYDFSSFRSLHIFTPNNANEGHQIEGKHGLMGINFPRRVSCFRAKLRSHYTLTSIRYRSKADKARRLASFKHQ